MLKDLLRRAQDAAQRHLPESVRDTGRRLVDAVLERAPQSVQERVAPLLRGDPAHEPEASADDPVDGASAPADDPLDFRDTQKRVVLFGYPEDAATDRVAALLTAEGIVFRRQNLHMQPREAMQIASMTGVMVAPYVFIHGKFWGGEGEMESLRALGELAAIVDNRLDELSPEARRIGRLKQSFDDAITVANVVDRLRRGHILRVDDLDCWYEAPRAGQPSRFFHDGAPRPEADIPDVAAEIVRRVESEGVKATWVVDPNA
ncbi:MAG: glutaredoxin [Myxococcales bacterium]|nr:glutaredoxin [Myxococcales bacterium]